MKLFKRFRKIPYISNNYDEGKIWDLWMFSHILSGVILGFLFELLELDFLTGFFAALLLMILWEIGEIYFRIKETAENRILDVVYGIISYSLAFSVSSFMSPWLAGLFLILFVIIKGLVDYYGWRAFQEGEGR